MGLSHLFLPIKQNHWQLMFYLFKKVCIMKIWKIKAVPPFRAEGQSCLLSSIIEIRSASGPESRVAWRLLQKIQVPQAWNSSSITQPRPVSSRPRYALLWELRRGKLVPENDDSLVITAAEGNKLSFVPNPGVSCLLPAPMKWWQANLLACK